MNHSAPAEKVVTVAVAAPLFRLFDYLLPANATAEIGCRVLVPFGHGQRIGFIMPRVTQQPDAGRELKQVIDVIDVEPLIDPSMRELMMWAAAYYQHPVGEVMESALPTRLRRRLAEPAPLVRYRLAMALDQVLEQLPANASRQRMIVQTLADAGEGGLERAALRHQHGELGDALQRLTQRALVEELQGAPAARPLPGPTLNRRQRETVERIDAAAGSFACFLIKGVTGSGKTEVYLECARRAIERGHQVLVLVPEIALTPQLVTRFRERLARPVAVLHSALADGERQRAWLDAARGDADVVLGTRSAVFSQMPRPGLIIIDEEHDTSFKQQEGFRYNARDIAIKRASLQRIPVVLGSATPSLESYHNTTCGRFIGLELPQRAGAANLPDIRLVDTLRWPLTDGLSKPLTDAIEQRLGRHEQSLVFINRRGFAPVVMCGGCGWQARCSRCDTFLTLHRRDNLLRCHHCGYTQPAISNCPSCGADDVYFAGVGTQRVEQALVQRFPAARILRIDRDTSSARGVLEQQLDQVRRHEVDILVGTQLLSKGHDFPAITLVGVLNCDQGMYSIDFRAAERLFQLVTQVGGRAGRGAKRGLVLMQTRFTDHPCMDAIRRHDYDAFADAELTARRTLAMPPFSYLVLIRAESVAEDASLEFLRRVQALGITITTAQGGDVELMDPVPAPMERRAGRFRAQLMIQARKRSALRRFLGELVPHIESDNRSRRVRWSVDVDPVDLY